MLLEKVRKLFFQPIAQKFCIGGNGEVESYVFLKENGSLLSPDARAHVLKVIMPDEVSRFFLFDGELLQEYEELLLEGTEVGSKIKDSIETILGVPVLTNSAIDSQSILDDYRKEKNKIAQSNAQTQKIATQMEGLEAEKREQTELFCYPRQGAQPDLCSGCAGCFQQASG